MKLSWEIDGVQVVVDKLEDGIEAGMERAVENIIEHLTRHAVNTIRVEKRVFTGQLIKSFDDQTDTADISDGHHGRLLNISKHAGSVEHGVHRSKYVDGGPPISALMPWVLANLQDWQLSDGDDSTGGNTLKQSVPEEVTQTVDKAINWTNTTFRGFTKLDQTEQDEIESTLKSNLDSTSADVMYRHIRSWKTNSNPNKGDTEKIVQYSSDIKETFGIDATPRGDDLYTPEPTYDETKEALRTLHEVSKIYAYNHLDGGGGDFIAHRYPQRTEISKLGKQIWENPLDTEWNLDVNVINNYSTERKEVDMFDKGILHNALIDIEDDLLVIPDHIVDARNDHEAEVHFRGDKNFGFHRDDTELTAIDGTRMRADEVTGSDFDTANFADLTDDELVVLANLVKYMADKDVTVDTQEARDRLNSWLDEFLSRDVYTRTDDPDYKWEMWVDSITS